MTKRQRSLIKGRPLGTKKRRKFEETRVGYILKYEATKEYELILQSMPDKSIEPPIYELIKAVTNASPDPIFKTKRFYSALDDYRINGIYTRPKKPPTPDQLLKYEARRKHILHDFIWNNRFLISALK